MADEKNPLGLKKHIALNFDIANCNLKFENYGNER